ncbi:DegT/DnrJ/EryC1/StrS family aminotransferase [Gammaproteobacteria bacterium]|nr:DegT/DnrJ/EryC1/StrS family aminotransferase [Gammaproteobacteria bacterium]
MINFLDLPKQYRLIKKDVDNSIKDILENGSFIGGSYVSSFEKEFAKYCSAEHCVGVANGTDALEISIEALNFKKGSEIIVPANSFISSAEAVTRQGHKVVFADVNLYNYTLDADDVRRRITKKTSAIIAVHLYGHPCDMNAIKKIANEFNLKIIEDCAQAHGAEFEGERIGSIGDIGCFSFYPGKNLGAYGDGGAIVTNDDELAKKTRMIANHGRIAKYDHVFEGRNSRLDSIQAAVLLCKLKYIEEWTDRRINIANRYLNEIKNKNQITLPKISHNVRCVFHLFVLRNNNRKKFIEYLNTNNISNGIHYPIALPKLEAFKYLNQHDEHMNANNEDKNLVSIPMGEHLTDDEVTYIIEKINDYPQK